MSFRDNAGKEIKKKIGMIWNKFRSLGFILTDKSKNQRQRRPKIRLISGPIVWRSNMVTHREGKEDAPNLRVEDGTKNTVCCTSDRVTRAEIRARTVTKDIVAVAHSFKWKWDGEAMWLEWTSADEQRLGQ